GLMGQISSLEPAYRPPGGGYGGGDYAGRPDVPGRPDYPGGGFGGGGFAGGGRDARGVEGSGTGVFPRPRVRGYDVAAGCRGANQFCRRQGLGAAVWFDSQAWADEAVGPDGRFVGRSSVLRDLLCRKY